MRAALYIDGFNLYHAIDELGLPWLKWANYWRLGEIIIPAQTERLVRVVYATAYYPGDSNKRWRHEQVVGAQKVYGVSVSLGHYVHADTSCHACGSRWQQPSEKQGDLNVALSLLHDAFTDVFDHAYLLSADSDQVATVRMMRQAFPNKPVTVVAPPGRPHSNAILNAGCAKISLNAQHLERSVMPSVVFAPGVANCRRPREYAPPDGWVHPDQRRQNRPPPGT